MQTFITASQVQDRHLKKYLQGPIQDIKLQNIKQQIRLIISSMPNQQACQQAAINIGLPINMLQFDKLLKFYNSQNNINSLNYTLNQLKILQKEAFKLKNKFNNQECGDKHKAKYIIRQTTKKQKTSGITQQSMFQQKKIMASNQKIRIVCEKQLATRIKIKKLLSTDFIERKNELIKKKVQTAKSMNKKAFKIFKNYKQKHQKDFQFFKIQVIYDPDAKKSKNSYLNSLTTVQPHRKITSKLSNNRETLYQQAHSQKHLSKGNWLMNSKGQASVKCMTAVGKIRSRYRNTEINKQKQKYNDIIVKKQQLQRLKEQQAIQRYIKKQQKILEIRQKQNKCSQSISQSIKKQKTNQPLLISLPIDTNNVFNIDQPTLKCKQKQLKKDTYLQQRVNKIKEQCRIKQERQEVYRLKRQRQNQQRSKQIQLGYVQNVSLMKQLKQQSEMRRQMIIKKRYQQQKIHKNKQKLIFNIHKYSDSELKKMIQDIRLAEKKDFTNSYQAK